MILTVIREGVNRIKIDMLYMRYRKLLYKKAFLVLENKDFAEDAVAETISIIIKNKSKIANKDELHIRNYMVRVCGNVAIKMKKNPEIPFENIDDLYDLNSCKLNPENLVLDNERYLKLKCALEELKPEYKNIIMFRYSDGMSVQEISEITGLKVETVRKRLQRSRNMLAELLKKEDVFDE